MKLTIDDREIPAIRQRDWTFREADKVLELTRLKVGDLYEALIEEEPKAALAFGIVGYMRDGKDPDELLDMSISSIVLDLSDGEGDGPGETAAAETPQAGSDAK